MARRLALFLLCAFLQAGEASKTAVEIRALIASLASPDYAVRARAHGELLRREKEAAPFVREALAHKDPEVRRRARRIWRVPSWAWPLPRTTYDRKTRMPREVLDRVTCIRLVLVSPGDFYMGKRTPVRGERPRQRVRISRPFYLGRCEITHDEWNRIMNPKAPAKKNTQQPKTEVSMVDIQRFCNITRFRLPTEAEWEHACRAGTATPSYGKPDRIAWHFENSLGYPHRVALKLPNKLGLFDTLGNVKEVCAEVSVRRWGEHDIVVDPGRSGWYVARGGSCNARELDAASSARAWRANDVGFRVARAP